jgi:hypothetical protein
MSSKIAASVVIGLPYIFSYFVNSADNGAGINLMSWLEFVSLKM